MMRAANKAPSAKALTLLAMLSVHVLLVPEVAPVTWTADEAVEDHFEILTAQLWPKRLVSKVVICLPLVVALTAHGCVVELPNCIQGFWLQLETSVLQRSNQLCSYCSRQRSGVCCLQRCCKLIGFHTDSPFVMFMSQRLHCTSCLSLQTQPH